MVDELPGVTCCCEKCSPLPTTYAVLQDKVHSFGEVRGIWTGGENSGSDSDGYHRDTGDKGGLIGGVHRR
jgi:hypothetical protein